MVTRDAAAIVYLQGAGHITPAALYKNRHFAKSKMSLILSRWSRLLVRAQKAQIRMQNSHFELESIDKLLLI